MLLESLSLSTAGLAVALTGLLYLLKACLFPTMDPLEPPLLKPRVPIFGHIISMMTEKAGFYTRLFNERRMPICTLPMLNGKLYVINSPSLIQAALRNNDISFDPFIVEFSKGIFGQNEKQVEVISRPTVMKELLDIIHSSLLGEPLHRLNVVALEKMMGHINVIQPNSPAAIPDAFIWIRDMMTEATAVALFGKKNPITPEHVHLLWTFDKSATLLAIDVAPSLIAGESMAARSELNKLFLPFYEARCEEGPDVSDIVRKRTAVLRAAGYNDLDLAVQELMLPWVGSTNTIPALFWLFVNLFARPEYLERVQAEIEAITTIEDGPNGRKALVDSTKFEKHCPVLNACYQETLRMYLHSVGNRRAMNDTKIQDLDGREYLLKKGTNVQWPPMVTHFIDTVWGDDADTFNPERFMKPTAQDEKARRGALLPFGGGRHLCPGRKFAFAEILGFTGVLALGFTVEGLALPDSTDPIFGSAPRRPAWGASGPGFKLGRRPGWEDVTWTFKK